MEQHFYSHGKLLITGEYLVMDGALALALPTIFGQSLDVKSVKTKTLIWQSLDYNNTLWFKCHLNLDEGFTKTEVGNDILNTLLKILSIAKQLNPLFFNSTNGYNVTTTLDFPKDWGLGSSSTLINNMANWANIDAFRLLDLTFGGSGYDIACAQQKIPLTYSLNKDKTRNVLPVVFNPPYKDQLFFIYLNKKQNSQQSVLSYKRHTKPTPQNIKDITYITKQILECNTLEGFQKLITAHEQMISKIINQNPIQQRLFNDFEGRIKSLGAWGGDFILAASKKNPSDYFKSKGFHIVIPYKNMVLT